MNLQGVMTMSNQIQVITVATGEMPVLRPNWEYSHENMNKAVGGWLEAVRVSETVVLWINEEGQINDLPVNFFLLDSSENPINRIHGNVIFTGLDEAGSTVGLKPEDIELIERRFVNRAGFVHYK
ncbi:DUF3846 domain-containing protein [Bacillus cereus]|uniref:DUF3846 domain-containing protein n=1 Tax=Bacillus cereus TaxID=1396 RepID=UPI0035583606